MTSDNIETMNKFKFKTYMTVTYSVQQSCYLPIYTSPLFNLHVLTNVVYLLL